MCITSDKCYENKEQSKGYKENDQLGGKDPYSASKASAEILPAKKVSTTLYNVIKIVPILDGTAILRKSSIMGSSVNDIDFFFFL